jgi:hypothetical protein
MLFLQLCARMTTFKGLKTAIYVRCRCVVVYVPVRDYHPEISLLTRTLSRAVIFCRPYYSNEMAFPLINGMVRLLQGQTRAVEDRYHQVYHCTEMIAALRCRSPSHL